MEIKQLETLNAEEPSHISNESGSMKNLQLVGKTSEVNQSETPGYTAVNFNQPTSFNEANSRNIDNQGDGEDHTIDNNCCVNHEGAENAFNRIKNEI